MKERPANSLGEGDQLNGIGNSSRPSGCVTVTHRVHGNIRMVKTTLVGNRYSVILYPGQSSKQYFSGTKTVLFQSGFEFGICLEALLDNTSVGVNWPSHFLGTDARSSHG